MRRPVLLMAVAFAVGAAAGPGLPAGAAWWLVALAAAGLSLALAARGIAAAAVVSAAALATGAAAAAAEAAAYGSSSLRCWVEASRAEGRPVQLHGVAARDPAEEAERAVLLLDVHALVAEGRTLPLQGRVRVEIGGAAAHRPEVIQGDRMSVWAQVRPVGGLSGPGLPEAEARARVQGLHALGYGKSGLLLAVERAPTLSARCRRWARGKLQRVVLPGPEQAVVKAMVLGERAALDRETLEAFRAAGTYHVLALSGAQVALVAALVVWALRRLRAGPLVQAAACCVALAFYASLVGGEVPITRAAVMAMVLAAGRCFDLEADMANLLGLAALLLLVHRPSAVADVSFQLSFVATLGIVLLTPALARLAPRLPLRLDLALACSLAAQAALAPLLVVHFHRLPLAALALNLVAAPLAGATLLLGAAAIVAPPWAEAAARLGDLAWLSAHALLRSAEAARWLPGLDLRLPTPPPLTFVLYAGGLAVVARGRLRAAGALTLTAALTAFAAAPPADGRLHLTVLDVGQGDSLIVRSPRGSVFLVDAGGRREHFDAGEAVVGPALWSLGARKIETVVLTHAHPDHAGGLSQVLRAFPVREAWEGMAPRRDVSYEAVRGPLGSSGARRLAVARGYEADWDGVLARVLWPSGGTPPWRTRNDDSVVLELRLGEVRFLLTGDIERAAEEALGPVRAQVVKVAHHGSRSSSGAAFVARVGALAAVASAGARNPFGHPHPEVVRRWEAAGVLLFRTDRDGAVTFATDGHRLWVRTHHASGERRLR